MNRRRVEHILRAAGAITGHQEWVIVGSQAILGAVPDAPSEITVSEELDLFAPGDEHATDLIDGCAAGRAGPILIPRDDFDTMPLLHRADGWEAANRAFNATSGRLLIDIDAATAE